MAVHQEYGHKHRHLGEDRYVRVHIYPNMAAANADVATADARIIYVADLQTFFGGKPGAWVDLGSGSGSGGSSIVPPVSNPGDLPDATPYPAGSIINVVLGTGVFTLQPGEVAASGVNPGDVIEVSGSLDTGANPWLDGAYTIIAKDDGTDTVTVDPGDLPAIPVPPSTSFGNANLLVGGPINGAIAIVDPDPVTGGPALWVFQALTNSWVRHTDADPRIVLIDASRIFTAFPQVDATAGSPTTGRMLIPLDYLNFRIQGILIDAADVLDIDSAGAQTVVQLDWDNTGAINYAGKRITFAGTGTTLDGNTYDILSNDNAAQMSVTLTTNEGVTAGAGGTADVIEDESGVYATEEFVNDVMAAHLAAFNHASFLDGAAADALIGTNHELPTSILAGLNIQSIASATDRVTFAAPLPAGVVRPGMVLTIAGTVSNNGTGTVYAVGADFVDLKPGSITVSEGAGGTGDIARGWDHDDLAASAGGLPAHIANPADPHAAAGYLTAATVGIYAPSYIFLNNAIAAHDTSPMAHGNIQGQLDALSAEVDGAGKETKTTTAVVIEPPATHYRPGMPVITDARSGIWRRCDAGEQPEGMCFDLAVEEAPGTADVGGNIGTDRIAITGGSMALADFVIGHGYRFPTVWAGDPEFLILGKDEAGGELIVQPPVPATAAGAAVVVAELPAASTVVLSGITRIPNARPKVGDAAVLSIRRASDLGGFLAQLDLAETPILEAGDQLVLSGHTLSEDKNGTYEVLQVVEGLFSTPAVVLAGSPRTLIPATTIDIDSTLKKITFDNSVSVGELQAGMALIIASSGSGNDGIYTVDTNLLFTDPLENAVTVIEALAADEIGVATGQVDTDYAAPFLSPGYPGLDVLGSFLGALNIIAIDQGTGIVKVNKNSLNSPVGGVDTLRITGPVASGDYPITAVNVVPADYDEITVSGLPVGSTRTDGIWGYADVVDRDAANVDEIDVDDGAGDGVITFKAGVNLVTLGVLAGDSVYLNSDDNFYIGTVKSVDSAVQMTVDGLIGGTDKGPGVPTGSCAIQRLDYADGGADVSSDSETNSFDNPPSYSDPSVPFYFDGSQNHRYSKTRSVFELGHQLDAFTFNVKIERVEAPITIAGPITHIAQFGEVIFADPTGGQVDITLPDEGAGRVAILVKAAGTVNANTQVGDTIGSAAATTVTRNLADDSLVLERDGVNSYFEVK